MQGRSIDPAWGADFRLPIANAASGLPDSLNSKTLPDRERFLIETTSLKRLRLEKYSLI